MILIPGLAWPGLARGTPQVEPKHDQTYTPRASFEYLFGITAAAGTRLALQTVLLKGFKF